MTTFLAVHDPKWSNGLPIDEADRAWLGQSADGRQWLLMWSTYRDQPMWVAVGFLEANRPTKPEVRSLYGDDINFIVRHMELPATIIEESQAYSTSQKEQAV